MVDAYINNIATAVEVLEEYVHGPGSKILLSDHKNKPKRNIHQKSF